MMPALNTGNYEKYALYFAGMCKNRALPICTGFSHNGQMRVCLVLSLIACLLACSDNSPDRGGPAGVHQMGIELTLHEDNRVTVAERVVFQVSGTQFQKGIVRLLPGYIEDRSLAYRPIPHSWLSGERVDPGVSQAGKLVAIKHQAVGLHLPEGPNRLDWQYEIQGASVEDDNGVIVTVLRPLGGKLGGIGEVNLDLRFPKGVAVTAANVTSRIVTPDTAAKNLAFDVVSENHLSATARNLPSGTEIELTVRW